MSALKEILSAWRHMEIHTLHAPRSLGRQMALWDIYETHERERQRLAGEPPAPIWPAR